MDATQRPREQMLIGLYSPAPQSGKSTVARLLTQEFGFRRLYFAQGLKDMLDTFLDGLGLSGTEILYHREEGKEVPIPAAGGRTYRHLAQTIGTDWGRKLVHPDIWVRPALARFEKVGGFAVIDDMRFPNEYRAVLDAGGEVWRITRPDATRPNAHVSEGALDGLTFDLDLVNDGTVEELQEKVRRELR